MSFIDNIINFFKEELTKHPSTHTRRINRFLLRIYQVSVHSAISFIKDECPNKAATLSFYTITSIVPFLAVFLGISKGFGLDKYLMSQIMLTFAEQKEILSHATQYATTMLENTKGGVLVGFGVLVLFYTVISLLGSIETTFNKIWLISKSRSIFRQFTDYFASIIVATLFITLMSSLNVFLTTFIDRESHTNYLFSMLGPVLYYALKTLPYILSWIFFTYLYIAMPNGRSRIAPRIWAGIFAGSVFQVWQWFYILFQMKLSNYGAIYGSFAAIPLFFIWIQVSWIIVLAGAEIASHLEHEIDLQIGEHEEWKTVSQKEFGLMVLFYISRAFNKGRPPVSAAQIGKKLGLSSLYDIHDMIAILEKGNLIVQIEGKSPRAYQPCTDTHYFHIKTVCDIIERESNKPIKVRMSPILIKIDESMKKLDDLVARSEFNIDLPSWSENNNHNETENHSGGLKSHSFKPLG